MLPGNLNRAPGQLESCSRATCIVLPGNLTVLLGNREHLLKESLHLGARALARAGTTGNRSTKSNEDSVLTATDELRTYKINLLGKSKWRIVLLGNGFNRAPGQLIASTDTSVLPGNLRSIPDMIPCEANCFLFA